MSINNRVFIEKFDIEVVKEKMSKIYGVLVNEKSSS